MCETPPYTWKTLCVGRVFLTVLIILMFSDNVKSDRRSFLWQQAASPPYHKPSTQSHSDHNWILTPPFLHTSRIGVQHWDSAVTFCLTSASQSLWSFIKPTTCLSVMTASVGEIWQQETAKCKVTVQGSVLFPLQHLWLSWCCPSGQGPHLPCCGNFVCKAQWAHFCVVQEQQKTFHFPLPPALSHLGPLPTLDKGKHTIWERSSCQTSATSSHWSHQQSCEGKPSYRKVCLNFANATWLLPQLALNSLCPFQTLYPASLQTEVRALQALLCLALPARREEPCAGGTKWPRAWTWSWSSPSLQAGKGAGAGEEQFCLKHTSLWAAVTWRAGQTHNVIIFIIHKSPVFHAPSQLYDTVDQTLLEKE